MTDASELLDESETFYERVEAHLRPTAEWFHDHEGEMFERNTVTEDIGSALDLTDDIVDDVITELVTDTVDPVAQARTNGTRYVGVVEYHEFDGAYGYIEYDDIKGQQHRVVCQQCVNEAHYDTEVTHATENAAAVDGGVRNIDAGYDELLEKIHDHYEVAHDTVPEDVETGATLASGTTVGGNTVWHDGNGNSKAVSAVDGSSLSLLDVDETQNRNYVEPQVTTSEGTSFTADLSQANYHKVTLTGDVSFDFSNVDASDINSVVLHLVQDGTGGRTPSFTPTVVWDGGSAPSWSTAANAEDVITLIHDQNGGQWLGFESGLGMA